MAIRGLSTSEQNWYVCRDDDGKRDTLEESRAAGATIFYFSAIPGKIMARLNDATQYAEVKADFQSQIMHQRGSQKNYDAFRYGVVGWENFLDDNDKPIEFKREQEMAPTGGFVPVVSEASMDGVRLATYNEVGGYVFNKNSLQDDQRKKLEGLVSRFDDLDTSNAPNVTTSSEKNEDVSNQPSTTDEKPTSQGLPGLTAPLTTPKSATGSTRKRASSKTPAPGA